LSWGGLSSISKDHHLFQPKHTGHDNTSYHRGDSWFFINNLAAIVMSREGSIFKKEFESIFRAGVRDILNHGYAGHLSELSSASFQEAGGCYAQAWSVGTFLELAEELFYDD
jgi:glycogen debranching enzyme